jgi:hypothetical protein
MSSNLSSKAGLNFVPMSRVDNDVDLTWKSFLG